MKEYDWFGEKYDANVELTHSECMEILSNIDSQHDSSMGVSRDTIEHYISEYLDEKPTKEEIELFPFKPTPIPNTEGM